MTAPRIVFAGTPDFAATHLQALLDGGITPVAVYTQPDRPAKRGHKITPSPVKTLAVRHNLEVLTPETLKDPSEAKRLGNLAPDVCVVVAYGLILPPDILSIPVRGCVNVHASLLPAWRGAAPIQRALLNGDAVTGVSIMRLQPTLDTGPVYRQVPVPISADDTSQSLTLRLAQEGARALVDCLPGILNGSAEATPQDESLASYAAKITKDDARLDFTKGSKRLELQIRAMYPWPVAYCVMDGVAYKVFSAECAPGSPDGAPGEIAAVLKDGILVNCADGLIKLSAMQAPGRSRVGAGELARSKPQIFHAGAAFEV